MMLKVTKWPATLSKEPTVELLVYTSHTHVNQCIHVRKAPYSNLSSDSTRVREINATYSDISKNERLKQ